jgi:hypothetical protein
VAEYNLAHIREQGIDLIIIPLDSSFGYKTTIEQKQVANALQTCANVAGLAGIVVPVWDTGGGRMGFLAPPNLHPYFSSIGLAFVAANINQKLTCG